MYSDGPGNKTHFPWKLALHLNNAQKLYVIAIQLPAVDKRHLSGKHVSLLSVALKLNIIHANIVQDIEE